MSTPSLVLLTPISTEVEKQDSLFTSKVNKFDLGLLRGRAAWVTDDIPNVGNFKVQLQIIKADRQDGIISDAIFTFEAEYDAYTKYAESQYGGWIRNQCKISTMLAFNSDLRDVMKRSMQGTTSPEHTLSAVMMMKLSMWQATEEARVDSVSRRYIQEWNHVAAYAPFEVKEGNLNDMDLYTRSIGKLCEMASACYSEAMDYYAFPPELMDYNVHNRFKYFLSREDNPYVDLVGSEYTIKIDQNTITAILKKNTALSSIADSLVDLIKSARNNAANKCATDAATLILIDKSLDPLVHEGVVDCLKNAMLGEPTTTTNDDVEKLIIDLSSDLSTGVKIDSKPTYKWKEEEGNAIKEEKIPDLSTIS